MQGFKAINVFIIRYRYRDKNSALFIRRMEQSFYRGNMIKNLLILNRKILNELIRIKLLSMLTKGVMLMRIPISYVNQILLKLEITEISVSLKMCFQVDFVAEW